MVGADARGKMVQVRPVAREVVPDKVVNQVDLVVREVDRDRVDSPVVDVVLSDHNVHSSLFSYQQY